MFYKNPQFLYILALASTCCKGYIFDFQSSESRCVYKCSGVSYDLENMDKSLKLVRSAVSELITLKKSMETSIRGNRASINILTSKISELEKENEVLKEKLEQEKAMRISLQNMVFNNQERQNRTEGFIGEMKEKVENDNLKTEAVKNDLGRLETEVKRVLENETHLSDRLNSVETSSARMSEPLGKENIVKKVNTISARILALSVVQYEQKNLLSSLENQMQSFANKLSTMDNSERNMSVRMEHLDLQMKAVKQKQSTFDDILINRTFSEAQKDYQKQGIDAIQGQRSILQNPQHDSGETQKNDRKQMINIVNQKQAATLHPLEAEKENLRNYVQRFPTGVEVKSSLGVCELEKSSGPCAKSYERWYYDAISKDCFPFSYGGCLGNQNRFRTKTACEEMCKN